MRTIRLAQIAYARSGDKGSSANVGVIARAPEHYEFLRASLSVEKVKRFFEPMGIETVVRYELPNLHALNFVLAGILGRGGSVNLRIDAQGKALGQAILEMAIEVPDS